MQKNTQGKEARLLFDRYKIVERREETKTLKTYIAIDTTGQYEVTTLNVLISVREF